ncbi:secretion accessory protein EsaB/YukD [Gracilibacillus boraciitolerans JCM 21714]|uniref:Secretion accessory protein EsaB/YukD n=1 Tax=Gracilibacillus boraciitolerans JCM 21714 TaxID=1298598 RepID=W4VMA4_9BACI|nr:EsaB/YukD family protein [Gracilibacillus boraciitolerans]GAE94505.1 secretion accessory protein EsaB/YukD [Gracilibacillus boraciitolerans JCM 21714]
MKNSHIDVTIDFRESGLADSYDLKIPVHISVKQLLQDVMAALKISDIQEVKSVIKVKTKGLVLADDDMLIDYPVTNGDILTVLR